jgi:hypothetical protein
VKPIRWEAKGLEPRLEHTIAEMEHASRARWLRMTFNGPGTTGEGLQRTDFGIKLTESTIEKLAEFLHQQYRATTKAMVRLHKSGPVHLSRLAQGAFLHDHGWGDCYGKKREYFLRRAAWLMTDFPAYNGRLGKGGK